MYSTTEKKNLNEKPQRVAADLNDGVTHIREDVRSAASNVRNDLEDLARQAGKSARQFVGSAEQNVSELAESVTTRIYDNPVQSSLIAMGVGLLIGLSLFRGRR